MIPHTDRVRRTCMTRCVGWFVLKYFIDIVLNISLITNTTYNT